MVKLSIIIPYFETYKLTCQLLDKLIPQLTEETEAILIDDGCYEGRFEKYGDYMKIYWKENEGVAKTRNEGRRMAKGKYIAFIDCDDMISDNYVQVLLNAIDQNDTDVINFNWVDIPTGIEYHKPQNYAPWKAIYKKETTPAFREDMKYGSEDVPFQEEIASGKYTIAYIDKPLYYYNSGRVGSLIWKKEHEKEEKK